MRFSVTALGRTPHHVVIGAAPETPIIEAAARIAEAADGPDAALYLGGRRLDPRTTLATAGLFEGAVVGLGKPVESPVGETALLELHIVSGADAGTVVPIGMGSYHIGSAAHCALRIKNALAHATEVIVLPDGTVSVTVGTGARLIGVRPPGPAAPAEAGRRIPWPAEADLEVGDALVRWVLPAEPDSSVETSEDGVGRDFNRPPRIIEPVPRRRHKMPTRPTPPGRAPFPLLIVLMPALMGGVMVLILHSIIYIMFMLFSPVFGIANWLHGKRNGKKDYKRKSAEYVVAKARKDAEIAEHVAAERVLRSDLALDPAAALLTATGPGRRLWERRRADADHLVLRIGTVDQPSLVEIDDPAASGSHGETVRWNVPSIPVGVGVADRGVVALAGPPERVKPLAGWLVAQAAIEHSPRDVRVLLLTGPDGAADWEWLRWLPHARSPYSANQILIGNDEETVAYRISELLGILGRRTGSRRSAMSRALFADPDILVVVDGARRLREVPGLVQILTDGPAVRIFSLCLDREVRLLPEEATSIVVDDGERLTLRQDGVPETTGIRPDLPRAGWHETVARALAPLRDASPDDGNVLPGDVRLLDLLDLAEPDPAAVAARWQARPASTTALIGVGYNGPLSVDLAADGPHALIAGTTGSGKSELLQTLVAALAVANRPDELTFLLIDYKGGSAFRDCVDLPHTLGMVTDLDGHLVTRVLESLGAELRRRERLLAEHGAKDHPGYQILRRRDPALPPLPRLVLIVDEFATLVREVPAFVPGVVSIAQRGRSLGLHLVLATQRPAGVITGDVRANTNLRIALRVIDPGESSDVIDTNDAASIPPNLPGRALVRLAHKAVAAFQTAYTGAPYEQSEEELAPCWAVEVPWSRLGRQVDPPPTELPEIEDHGPTDLAVLVKAMRQAAADLQIDPQPRPWLPALPPRVTLADLPPTPPAADGGLPPVAIGLEDLPTLQLQRPVMLDLDTLGHLFVIGASRSGRSQTLRTIAGALAARHATANVHIYAIDAAGGALAALGRLPHTGAVASRNDVERVDRLLTRLDEELDRRQEQIAAHHASNLTELRSALPPGPRPAHLVLMIDGWESLYGTIHELDNGRLIELIYRLLREGGAAGIHVVAAGDRGLLNGKIGTLNDNRLLLRMNDKSDYLMIGIKMQELPTVVESGRVWRSGSLTEAQIALLAADPAGQAQADALQRIGQRAAARDEGMLAANRPFTIGELPVGVDFATAYQQVTDPRPLRALLGLGADQEGPVMVDFAGRANAFMVVGPPGSGRSTTLATFAISLLAARTRLLVITPRDSPLRRLADDPNVRVLTPPAITSAEVTGALSQLGAPCVVLIDDIDLMHQHQAADPALREIVATGRDRGIGIAVAGSVEPFNMSLTSWLGDLRRVRQAVLLSPQMMSEGDLIGTRIPADHLRRPLRPGRGFIANAATGGLVAVAIPLTRLRERESSR